jgi:hypothetical protein
VNASKYQGHAPHSTLAQRERRSAIATLGREEVMRQDAERVEYYRSLIRKVRSA